MTGKGWGMALVKQLPCATAKGMQTDAGFLQDSCAMSLRPQPCSTCGWAPGRCLLRLCLLQV